MSERWPLGATHTDVRHRLARFRAQAEEATLHPPNLVVAFITQALHEARLSWWRGVRFRSRVNQDACRAYAAMDPWEFEGINARQAWANWRTIPKSLGSWVNGRPLRVVDLCCGTGQSTAVLARHLPPGSRILGLERNPAFVARARSRRYLGAAGRPVEVAFHAQSVLDTFREPTGEALPDDSADLVHSAGALGCHFDPAGLARLAEEIDRVLRPGGRAIVDSRRSPRRVLELRRIFERRGFRFTGQARSCAFDSYVQLSLVKGG